MAINKKRTDFNYREEEFWEIRFQKNNIPWDIGEPSPSLIELEKSNNFRKNQTVIIPGCGNGHDALHFSRKGYKVSGVDWARSAVDELRAHAFRESLEIEILKSDIWNIPRTWYGTFDLWIEHTFYCAIDPDKRKDYLELVLKLLKPNGRIFGVFFITDQPVGSPILTEKSDGPPFSSTENEIKSLFSTRFNILKFGPSPHPHPDRGSFEWWADFQRCDKN